MMPSVLNLIHERAAGGSLRSQRPDPWHLALVVEGGGMRGVVAGGMVSALEEHDLVGCFDSIHGSSAGACAGAYFAAGQARLGTSIYYEDINNSKFINVKRFFLGKAIMNTDFLIDYVMKVSKRLDVAAFIDKPGFLNVVATNASTGKGVVYHHFRDKEHFFSVLKASITIPIVAGPPVIVDHVALFDGGMVQQIAVQSALDVGATHILVLMTRKADERMRPDGTNSLRFDHLLLRFLYGAKIANTYKQRNVQINTMLSRIDRREFGTNVMVESIVRPATANLVERLSIDGDLLRKADLEARKVVSDYLSRM